MAILALYHNSVVTKQLDSYAKHVVGNWQLQVVDFPFVNNLSFTQLFLPQVKQIQRAMSFSSTSLVLSVPSFSCAFASISASFFLAKQG